MRRVGQLQCDTELEHGKVKAPVLAKLHDQDEVGCADDQLVLKEIIETRLNESQVAVLMTTSEDGTEEGIRLLLEAGYYVATVIVEDEAIPECSGLNFTYDCSDASIEELFYLITNIGVSAVYPDIFQPWYFGGGTYITEAMDIARGGRFRKVPIHYPFSAWYTYYDETCYYWCQGVEYTWWGYCAFSGVCEGRSGSPQYESEFKFMTKAKLIKGDPLLSDLFLLNGEGI